MKGTLFVLVLTLVAAAAGAQIPGGAFTVVTVDSTGGNVGRNPSIATGTDGMGLIIYHAGQSLRAAHCSNPACSSASIATIVSAFAEPPTAIAIGADGLGLISYYDTGSGYTVAHCNDTACSGVTLASLGSGLPVALEKAGDFNLYSSITIGADGLGLVSHGGPNDNGITVAHCDNTACTSATSVTFDAATATARPTSIAKGADGLGLIAYFTIGSNDLKVAHCNDTACTAATTATLDSAGNAGDSLSLAIGADGLGLVSYYDMAVNDLKVAHCNDAACTSAALATIDSAGAVGQRSSITMGRDGRGLISYHDSTNGDLRVAHCTNAVCSIATNDAPDRPGLVGYFTAITIVGDGRGLVAYHDFTNGRLKAAHQATPGDFSSDGRTDLVFRHDVTGENLVWFMDGANRIGSASTNPSGLADTRWTIVGTNDFNGDGKADLLWRQTASGENVAWFMNGVDLVSGTFTTPPSLADVLWRIVGTGDFDLDGRPDILWHHTASGELVVWYMHEVTLDTGTFLTPRALADVRWKVAGVADFNQDGKPDILWHHEASGEAVIWYMDGSAMTGGTFTSPNGLADVDWRVGALGDYNLDGKPDIVWRHQTSGENLVWFMDNATLLSSTLTNPSSLPDVGWKLAGPR